MREFVIVGDSTCDLNQELRQEYDLDYVSMNYVIDDQEFKASLDWEGLSCKDFYDTMRKGKRITTTQVTTDKFEACFEKYLSEGKDVLYIGCSSALSGSVNLGQIVAREYMEKYPEGKIICVDSLISSFGQGTMMMKASELRKEGKTIEEVAAYIEEHRLEYQYMGTVGKLDYLKRAGRVTASSAFFGNLIGIKPMIISDAKGQNYAIKKVKGAGNAITEIAEYVKENIVDAENQTIYISHADDEESALKVAEAIKAAVPVKEIVLGYIGPIVGASVGPGTVVACFHGKAVTVTGEA